MTPEEQPTTRVSSVKKEENPAVRHSPDSLEANSTRPCPRRPVKPLDPQGIQKEQKMPEIFPLSVRLFHFQWTLWSLYCQWARFFHYQWDFFHFQWMVWSFHCRWAKHFHYQWDFFISSERYDLCIANETFWSPVNGMIFPLSVSERDLSITSERDFSITNESFSFTVNGMIFPLSVSEIFPLQVRIFHFQWTLWSFSIVTERDFSITSEIFFISSERYDLSIVSERVFFLISE